MNSPGGDVDIAGLTVQADSKYFTIAILTWVVHEIIITSDDAVNLFWMQRWSISKVMFFVNQFAAVFTTITITALNLTTLDSEYECAVLTGCLYVGDLLILSTETFMLATRVWALWRGSYIILTIFFLVVFSNFCNFLFTYGLALLKGTVLLNQSPYTGCFVMPGFGNQWVGVSNCLAYETLAIGLIICKSWLIRRVTGIKTPLFSMLLHDGLAHYSLFLAAKLFNVCSMLVPTVVAAVTLPASFPIILVSLTANRLFLRLRRTMLHQTPSSTGYTTAGVFPSKRSTGKGVAIVGGSDKAGRRMHSQGHSDLDDELLTLGEGDVEMSLRNKDGGLYPTASTRRSSTILLTPETPGSSINMDASVLDSKPYHAV